MKKSDYYRANGYKVDVHDTEFNQLSRGIGFSIFYISHLRQGPFFLAELEDNFAEGGSREEAIQKLINIIKSK